MRPVRLLLLLLLGLAGAGGCSLLTDLGGLTTPTGSAPAPEGGAEDAGADGRVDVADAADVTTPDADAFELVYSLDIPLSAKWNAPSDVPYATKPSGGGGAIRRVAYRLVLDDTDVRVEMDPFTQDVSKLGVPVDDVFQQKVENVVFSSTSPTLASVAAPKDGNIEFWSHCYSEGPDGDFDDDDERSVSEPDCYGSMQIHVAGSPVLSFNRWTTGNGIDVGIGKGPTAGRSDWTFAENAGRFAKRRLEIYVLR